MMNEWINKRFYSIEKIVVKNKVKSFNIIFGLLSLIKLESIVSPRLGLSIYE